MHVLFHYHVSKVSISPDASVNIGVSIGFGKSMIKWADERFRYYVTKEGPKPIKLHGIQYSMHYLKGWGKHVLPYLIGAGILVGVIFLINDSSRTEALFGVLLIWTLALSEIFSLRVLNDLKLNQGIFKI